MPKIRVWSNKQRKFVSYVPVDLELNNIFAQKDFVFQRSTSLYDSNNKEIFEGDIVQIENESREIIWGERTLTWCYRGTVQEHPIVDYKEFFGPILGNTLENPELLADVKF